MSGAGIILFAHGSRDPDWARPFHAIKRRIEAMQPGAHVEPAFLELMRPSLGDAAEQLAASCKRIVVAPIFMGQGAHLKRDVSKVVTDVREKHPDIEFELLPGVGEMEPVIDAIGLSIARAAAR